MALWTMVQFKICLQNVILVPWGNWPMWTKVVSLHAHGYSVQFELCVNLFICSFIVWNTTLNCVTRLVELIASFVWSGHWPRIQVATDGNLALTCPYTLILELEYCTVPIFVLTQTRQIIVSHQQTAIGPEWMEPTVIRVLEVGNSAFLQMKSAQCLTRFILHFTGWCVKYV